MHVLGTWRSSGSAGQGWSRVVYLKVLNFSFRGCLFLNSTTLTGKAFKPSSVSLRKHLSVFLHLFIRQNVARVPTGHHPCLHFLPSHYSARGLHLKAFRSFTVTEEKFIFPSQERGGKQEKIPNTIRYNNP